MEFSFQCAKFNLYKLCLEPLSENKHEAVEREAYDTCKSLTKSGRRRHKALHPTLVCHGPLPIVSEMAGIRHDICLKGVF